MDELRARAYLDLLLGKDSRPRQDHRQAAAVRRPGRPPRRRHRRGFAGRVTLTVPLATLTSLAGPARRARRARPDRPLAGPRPGHRRRAQPQDHVVRDRDRRARPRHRARLRPSRTQEPQETRRDRAAGVHLHPGQPGRAARRIRHLAAAHPRERAGPAGHPRPADHPGLRPPVRKPAATIRASSSGTCPRSGTPPVPARSAGDPPPNATSSTTPRTKRADGPVCAIPARSADMTTGSSSTPSGRSTSSPTAPSGGPPRPGVPTPPNPRGTPYEGPKPPGCRISRGYDRLEAESG